MASLSFRRFKVVMGWTRGFCLDHRQHNETKLRWIRFWGKPHQDVTYSCKRSTFDAYVGCTFPVHESSADNSELQWKHQHWNLHRFLWLLLMGQWCVPRLLVPIHVFIDFSLVLKLMSWHLSPLGGRATPGPGRHGSSLRWGKNPSNDGQVCPGGVRDPAGAGRLGPLQSFLGVSHWAQHGRGSQQWWRPKPGA